MLQSTRPQARELLMSDANVNSLNPSGSTLIHTAVRTGNVGMLELILSFRPQNIDVKEGSSVGGGTPLHVAAMLGDDGMIAMLVKHGAQATAQVIETTRCLSALFRVVCMCVCVYVHTMGLYVSVQSYVHINSYTVHDHVLKFEW